MLLLLLSQSTFADSDPVASPNVVRGRAIGPIEKLRFRSARERWEAIRQRLTLGRKTLPDGNEKPSADDALQAETAKQPPAQPKAAASDQTGTASDYRDEEGIAPITDILPYFDYEPAKTRQTEQDCLMLCPCPEGTDCQKPGGTKTCLCPDSEPEQQWKTVPYVKRNFPEAVFAWDASNIWYNSPYFEDTPLERYGHVHHELLQPFVSIHRFSTQLILLPYQATINPIRKKIYPLGYYRPGEWAPNKWYQIPLNTDAGAVQAGVATGLFFLFP